MAKNKTKDKNTGPETRLINVVRLLNLQGHNVQYRKRSDGSIRITQIDGVSYTGSSGNIQARAIVGVAISENRRKQLKKIRTKKSLLPENVQKKLLRVQRVWRKTQVPKRGRIKKRNIAFTLREYGEAETLRRLEESERYARGLAYSENVQWIISYITDTLLPVADGRDEQILLEVIDIIKRNKEKIRESDIAPIHDLLYDCGHYLEGNRSSKSPAQILAEIKKLYQ